MKPGPGPGSWPTFFSIHISFARLQRQSGGRRSVEASLAEGPMAGLPSCLSQGTRVWMEREHVWRLPWPKLRVRDRKLLLKVIQMNDKAKG